MHKRCKKEALDRLIQYNKNLMIEHKKNLKLIMEILNDEQEEDEIT